MTDPDDIEDAASFGAALTELRDRAGLTVRQVAAKAGLPRTTAGDYFSGKAVPSNASAAALPAILRCCGISDAGLLDAWERARVRVRRVPGPAPLDVPAPYRGLAPFRMEDAEWYHGRADLVAATVDAVRGALGSGSPLVVVGPSGAGKSSLVRAGVMPALADWDQRLTTPGGHPLPRPGTGPMLVVVDQAEELFTVAEQADYLDAVAELAAADSVVVVLVLRSDFYETALRHPVLAEALGRRTVVVGPLSDEGLREAILLPARTARLTVEDGLVEVLLRDFRPAETGSLPLLSHALLATWHSGNRRALTIAAYQATGGVAHAVEQSAEAVYAALDDERRHAARTLFLRLVHHADAGPATRRTVARAELPDRAAEVLDDFVGQRLITVDGDRVHISHEVLVLAWSRLQGWLDADRESLRLQRGLRAAAAGWVDSGRDPGGLHRGAVLAAAREAVDVTELNAVEREFLAASTAEQDSIRLAERRRVRVLRRWVACLVVMSLVALGLVVLVLRQRADALAERDLAISRQMALRAADLRATDPAPAARLALAAYRIAPTAEARSALLTAAAGPVVGRVRASPGTLAAATNGTGEVLVTGDIAGFVRVWRVGDGGHLRLVGEPVAVSAVGIFAVAVDPGGRFAAITGADRRVHLLDLADPARPVPDAFADLGGTGFALEFSADGGSLAVAGKSGVRVWRRDAAPVVLTEDADFKAVAFHPDGRTVVAGSADRTVRGWRDGVEFGAEFPRLGAAVNGLTFSRDGARLAVATGDRIPTLWDTTDLTRPVRLPDPVTGFTGPVYAVRISADGCGLAASGSDGTVRLADLCAGRPAVVLPHPSPVTEALYLPDGRVVSAAADGHVRLWSPPGAVITGTPGPVAALAFDQAGALMVSAGDVGVSDGGVRWWDVRDLARPVAGGPIVGEPGPTMPTGVSALSPDGRLLAVARADGVSEVWAGDTPIGPPLRGTEGTVESMAFTPDSRTLAIAGEDHKIHLWDLRTPSRPRLSAVLTGPANIVLAVAVSPDGTRLAAGSVDNQVYLWDIADPEKPVLRQRISGHTDYVYGVAFGLGGRVLATGGADKTVRLWDVSGDQVAPIGDPLTGPDNRVYSLAFVGSVLAAASTDKTVRIWTVADPAKPVPFATLPTSAAVYAVAISADGRTVAAGGAGKEVRLWELDSDAAGRRVCASADVGMTEAEWARLIPDLGYRDPCDGR
ncbi:helix-turn-helix domain-containing protein [Actinokineospora globicatena]|uniref:nSTAND1 domain-containing NTPase n=1 Tax=Actinokineospora globicatena TaxID=103729 RepID=UPI0020A4CC9A|nr:helix-turn-helix domain-containing protein [Actinokineospora globicatena]MCP2306174.1 WD40 repeat [Actinokineospora globicatena]GLW79949.1 hypothetical protein Aglo01_44300 [Actinokineospora globicatena]GLW86778.1 hypothetical protein Aglo02_44170 [Actinokineospora globicatena]